MSSYVRKRISCVCCGKEYEIKLLKGYSICRNNIDLDTNPHNPAIYDKVTICPRCGYATFTPFEQIDDSVCDVVYSKSYRQLLNDSTLDIAAKKLILSGLIYSKEGKCKEAGYSYLYAYWYLKEHSYRNAACACEKTIDSFEKYLSENEDYEIAIILVDLLRQMDRFDESLETLRSLDSYIINEPDYKAISAFEKKLIIGMDSNAHRLSEVAV